jgi:steroid 5-alpha reductase family enzyme
MTVAWLTSLVFRRIAVVDAFWGPAFIAIVMACVVSARSEGTIASWNSGHWLLAVLVTVWGLRLALHLARRVARETHEDRRYAAIRDRHQPNFAVKSLGIIFLLQAVIAWFVALPLTTAFAEATAGVELCWPCMICGAVVWTIGFVFEAGGDWQLDRFRRDPANAGRVLNSGFWALTRHPNYFGDFAVWWGMWLIAVGCGAAWWTVVSPLLMSVLLLKVSGVSLLERDIKSRRPGYAEYVRRTSAFFPWPPRS